jgi:D-glycero-alpha-D-manno-heptose-7-phosphate kinase
MIITRTPFRISFFGGGTDYPAWYREHGGAVLATTIDKYCYISCRYLPQFFEHRHRIVYSKIENVRQISEIQHPAVRAVLEWKKPQRGLELHHDGDLPARSGLGSSSSFTVGLLHALSALEGRYITKDQLAREALQAEQDIIREDVGSQDQISAAFGGFNRIQFFQDGRFEVAPIMLPKARIMELQQNLMLCFTGFSRYAVDIEKSKIANIGSRKAELRRIGEMVEEAIAILSSSSTSLREFGRLLDDGWRYKRSLSDKVSTPQIDQMYEAARSAGALGGKLLGAGGGGFLLLYVPLELQAQVAQALARLVHVPFEFERGGSRVVLYQPDGL